MGKLTSAYHACQKAFQQPARPIFRTLLADAPCPGFGLERQPSGRGANTWASCCAGVGKRNCRNTRACSSSSVGGGKPLGLLEALLVGELDEDLEDDPFMGPDIGRREDVAQPAHPDVGLRLGN